METGMTGTTAAVFMAASEELDSDAAVSERPVSLSSLEMQRSGKSGDCTKKTSGGFRGWMPAK
jgi:hypothetical protein